MIISNNNNMCSGKLLKNMFPACDTADLHLSTLQLLQNPLQENDTAINSGNNQMRLIIVNYQCIKAMIKKKLLKL